MPQVKGALMVCPHDVTVSTTAGYTINFTANEEQYVPPLAVPACRDVGAREIKRYTATNRAIPGIQTKGQITSRVTARVAEEEIVEEDILPVQDAKKAEPKMPEKEDTRRNDRIFPEVDTKIRAAILTMLEDINPDEWTNGAPKVAALNAHVKDMSVTKRLRDRVMEKMADSGDLPENLDELLG